VIRILEHYLKNGRVGRNPIQTFKIDKMKVLENRISGKRKRSLRMINNALFTRACSQGKLSDSDMRSDQEIETQRRRSSREGRGEEAALYRYLNHFVAAHNYRAGGPADSHACGYVYSLP
jgi:hypothetical protein